MLDSLKLANVGPAPEMEMKLAPRLNLITGDNGLGKTFLLDIAWWALTRTWAHKPALPSRGKRNEPNITYAVFGKGEEAVDTIASFDREAELWRLSSGRPNMPGLVVYARVDGVYGVWDPYKNYGKAWDEMEADGAIRPPAYIFNKTTLWHGLVGRTGPGTRLTDGAGPRWLCNGLIRDWVNWQKAGEPAFEVLRAVLRQLSRGTMEELAPGTPVRTQIGDAQDVPTVKMPYGEIPLTFASAGIQRVVGLAYLMVWGWVEHCRAAELLGRDPESRFVFLVDEVEAHLHPHWQRLLLPALLDVAGLLTEQEGVEVQVIAGTHSPLVLASVEPSFDEDRDAWFDLDLIREDGGAAVRLERRDFVRHGDVSNWLTSEAFDLKTARSIDGERAIEAARELLFKDQCTVEEARQVDRKLRQAGLPDIDPFWVRWGAFMEELEERRDQG